jgi:RNA polymerase sigma factor (sigma-70 family)
MTTEELFAKNKRLVFHMLKIVRPYGGGYMKRDWIQVGMIGLWKACQSYKPELALFSTYACNCIENEIKMEIRKVNSLGRKLHDTISWEDIPSDDISVYALHGMVNHEGIFNGSETIELDMKRECGQGRYCYSGEITCNHSGEYGYLIKVAPHHEDLINSCYDRYFVLG